MIEILDKVNDTYKQVADDIDMVIHPINNEVTFIKDMELTGHRIIGVIFKEDGTTLFLYKNLKNLKNNEII